jgi:hypothetical protein
MGSRFKFDDSGSNSDTSIFLTKPQGDLLYHNENDDVDMRNHKIINLKDSTEDGDAVTKKQLDEKAETLTNQLDAKANKTDLDTLASKVIENELKLNFMNTIKIVTKIDTLPITTGNNHLLAEVNSNNIIFISNFFFQTSNETQWHDLSNRTIKDILGLAYINQIIVGDQKEITLHTTNSEWWRKAVFTNHYSLKYKLEYCYIEVPVLLGKI